MVLANEAITWGSFVYNARQFRAGKVRFGGGGTGGEWPLLVLSCDIHI